MGGRCEFIAGDWGHPTLLDLLPPQSFSLIVTSDTLYEPASIPHLLRLLYHCLAPDGCVLIGSKRFYFGVGGGTLDLITQVETDGRFTHTVERVLEDGKSNIREIVSLTWKAPPAV